MKRQGLVGLVVGVVGLGLALEAAWAAKKPREVTLLLVPVRPRVVQLAFDMQELRSVAVVAWHGDSKTTEPVLHVWSGTDWQYVSLPDFGAKTFVPGDIGKVIVVGDKELVPDALLSEMPWCSNVERIETIAVADLINNLDRTLKFKESEWKWLADRYGLTLTDLNAGRRNKNPYDTPRSKLPLEKREFKTEKGGLPPAELIENPPAEEINPKTAPPPMPPATPPPPPPPAPEPKPIEKPPK
jgi:hypothetical protein